MSTTLGAETPALAAAIATLRRPIERTELLVAEEIASVGSLNDLVPITAVDGLPLGPSPVLDRLRDRYLAAVSGAAPHPAVALSVRVPDCIAQAATGTARRLDRAGRGALARRHLRVGLRRPGARARCWRAPRTSRSPAC